MHTASKFLLRASQSNCPRGRIGGRHLNAHSCKLQNLSQSAATRSNDILVLLFQNFDRDRRTLLFLKR